MVRVGWLGCKDLNIYEIEFLGTQQKATQILKFLQISRNSNLKIPTLSIHSHSPHLSTVIN